MGRDSFRTNHDQLTGFHVTLVSRTNQIKGTSLRGKNNRVLLHARLRRNASHGQRPEAAGIARRKNAVGTNHHQGECAFHSTQRIGHGLRQGVLAR